MARLTDQLSTDMSTKPVREPPAPSTGLATLFDGLSSGINVVQRTQERYEQDKTRKAAAERQAKEDQYRDEERSIPGQIVQGVERAHTAVFAQPTPAVDDPAEKQVNSDVSASVDKLSSKSTAVAQGKLPGISFKAALNLEYQALVSAHPNHVGKINEEFKKYGFQPSMALQAGEDMQSQNEAVREGQEKWQEDMYKEGSAAMPPELLATSTREQVIAQGVAATNLKYNLDLVQQQANLTLTNKNISEAERKAAEEQTDDSITQNIVVDAYNNSAPLMSALQGLMGSIEKAPLNEQQAAFERLAPQYDQWSANYKARVIAQAVGAGQIDTTKLEKQLDLIIDRGRSMWSGDLSVAKSNLRAFEAFKTSAKIDAAKAMPVFFYLQEANLRPTEIEAFSAGIASNPKLQEALKKEVQGFSVEFGEERASTKINNIVRILKGEATIQEFSPTQAREMMPTLYSNNKKLTNDYASGKDVGTDKVLNSLGTMISATRTLNSSSGLDAWVTASSAVAGRTSRASLIKATKDPENKDIALATIQGSRAASARLLDAMRFRIGYEEDGWTVSLNKEGRAVATQKKILSVTGGFNRATGPTASMVLADKPARIDWFINSWNVNIDNLVELNSYDPTGLKSATPKEISLFYGANKATGAYLKTAEEGIDAKREIDRQFDIVEDAFNGVPGMNSKITSSSVAGVPASRVMNYEARELGFKEVPSSVQTLGAASDFALKVNKAGAASSAMGTYQIVGQTMRTYAPRVFGENWRNVPFNEEAQEKIAKAIFHNNRGTAASLKKQWVSLSLEEAERVRKLPWEKAKDIIAAGESG